MSEKKSAGTSPSSRRTAVANNPAVQLQTTNLLERLVRCVVRTFYGFEHGVVVDAMLREKETLVRGDDLANMLHLSPKQVRTVLHQLTAGHLIVPYSTKLRTLEDDQVKARAYTYYYVDFGQFVDVVRYRLRCMDDEVGEDKDLITGNYSYICPRCSRTFTEFDHASILDRATNSFVCTDCKSPLLENQSRTHVDENRARREKLHTQLAPLYDMMKSLESSIFPRVTRALGVFDVNIGKVMAHSIGGVIGATGSGPKKSYLRELEYQVVVRLEEDAHSIELGAYGFSVPYNILKEREYALRSGATTVAKGVPPWLLPKWKQERASIAGNEAPSSRKRGATEELADAFPRKKTRASDAPVLGYSSSYSVEHLERIIADMRGCYVKRYVNELSRLLSRIEPLSNDSTFDFGKVMDCVEIKLEELQEPAVTTNGRSVLLTEVTEEDRAAMSAVEYEEYFALYRSFCDELARRCYRPIV